MHIEKACKGRSDALSYTQGQIILQNYQKILTEITAPGLQESFA